MSPELASLSDVQAIAHRAADYSQKYLLGITIGVPRYEKFPDADDDNGVYEFLVDCWILEGPSQAIIIGSASSGLRVIENLLVASSATGELLADINVPVEIRKNHSSGQLEVIGRASVNLPSLRLDEYNAGQLGIHHILELEHSAEDGKWRDAFGVICDLHTGSAGIDLSPSISWETSVATSLSTLAQLAYDDTNQMAVGMGGGLVTPPAPNPFQRAVVSSTSSVEILQVETIDVVETASAALD